jgi:hypothetical protein
MFTLHDIRVTKLRKRWAGPVKCIRTVAVSTFGEKIPIRGLCESRRRIMRKAQESTGSGESGGGFLPRHYQLPTVSQPDSNDTFPIVCSPVAK